MREINLKLKTIQVDPSIKKIEVDFIYPDVADFAIVIPDRIRKMAEQELKKELKKHDKNKNL